MPGSGKSFFCKMEMGSVFLSGDDEIIVIDPMNEYFDIAETYGGTVVNMSTYTDNYVNPLEMDVWSLDPNDSKGMAREARQHGSILMNSTSCLIRSILQNICSSFGRK